MRNKIGLLFITAMLLLNTQIILGSELTEEEMTRALLPLKRIPKGFDFGHPPILITKNEINQMIKEHIQNQNKELERLKEVCRVQMA